MQKKSIPTHKLDWLGILSLIAGGFIPAMFASFFGLFIGYITNQQIATSDYFLVGTNLVMWLGSIIAFDFVSYRQQTGQKLNFNMSITDGNTLLLIFPMMFGMMLISEFTVSQIPISGPFWGPLFEAFMELMESMTNNTATMFLLAVLMAPVFEEIVFRGIIQKGLVNKGINPKKAIWITAVLFGLVHMNPWQFVGATLLGYVLGLVYHKTNSLLLVILLHAFNNLTSTLLLKFTGIESFSDYFKISEWFTLLIGIVLFTISHQLFLKKYSSKF